MRSARRLSSPSSARAAPTMSTVVKRPRTCVSSHWAICGGATPITPTLSLRGARELVDQDALDHCRGRKPGRAVASPNIAANHRKAGLRVGALERLEAIIELMVAQRRGRIAERIHGRDDRMDSLRVVHDRRSGEVPERCALENVAVVEQQAVGRVFRAPRRSGRPSARARPNCRAGRGNNRRDRDWRADRSGRAGAGAPRRLRAEVRCGPGAATPKRYAGKVGTAREGRRAPDAAVKEALAGARRRARAGIGSRGTSSAWRPSRPGGRRPRSSPDRA